MPIVVDTESELTIDDIENKPVATPEENGVATVITDSIADTWQKINDYNHIISTISSSGIKNSEELISVLKDIVDDENKNVGKLMSALNTISPEVDNVEVGKEEANMKLTESINEDKLRVIEDILGRKLSVTEENELYDGWGKFYSDPESYRDSDIIEVINLDLDSLGLDKEVDPLTTDNLVKNEDEELIDDSSIEVDDSFEEDTSLEENLKMENKVRRIGTEEYDANEGRKRRIAQYRKLAQVDEGVQLTEGMINDWALSRTACFNNRSKDQVKAEILGQPWSDLEEN